jgi:hypothetical protein
VFNFERPDDGSAFQPKNVDLLDRLQGRFVVVQGKEIQQDAGRRIPFFQHRGAIILGNPNLKPHRFANGRKSCLNAVGFADRDDRLLGFHFNRRVTRHGDHDRFVSTIDGLGNQPSPFVRVLGIDYSVHALRNEELLEVLAVLIVKSVQTSSKHSSPAHPRRRFVLLRKRERVPDDSFLDRHTFLDGKPNFRVDLESDHEGIVGRHEPRSRIFENLRSHIEHTCPAANLCDIADQTITDLKSPCRLFLLLSDTGKGAIGSSERLVCFWRKKVGVVVHDQLVLCSMSLPEDEVSLPVT